MNNLLDTYTRRKAVIDSKIRRWRALQAIKCSPSTSWPQKVEAVAEQVLMKAEADNGILS